MLTDCVVVCGWSAAGAAGLLAYCALIVLVGLACWIVLIMGFVVLFVIAFTSLFMMVWCLLCWVLVGELGCLGVWVIAGCLLVLCVYIWIGVCVFVYDCWFGVYYDSGWLR